MYYAALFIDFHWISLVGAGALWSAMLQSGSLHCVFHASEQCQSDQIGGSIVNYICLRVFLEVLTFGPPRTQVRVVNARDVRLDVFLRVVNTREVLRKQRVLRECYLRNSVLLVRPDKFLMSKTFGWTSRQHFLNWFPPMGPMGTHGSHGTFWFSSGVVFS